MKTKVSSSEGFAKRRKTFQTILKLLLIVPFPTERKFFFSFLRNYPRQTGIPDFRSSLGDSIGVPSHNRLNQPACLLPQD